MAWRRLWRWRCGCGPGAGGCGCGAAAERREVLAVAALCAAWYALSSASNVVGKVALGEFPFPLTVALTQLASTALLSGPALWLAGVRPAPPLRRSRPLLPLAVAKFLTTLCSQVSLWKVPIAYAHTVKATTPLWTAALAWALWGERVSRRVFAALLVIAAGVAVASATELQFDALGLGAALAAAALLALQHLYSKRAMLEPGVHHLRLLQRLSQLACAMLAPLWAWRDLAALAHWRWSGRVAALLVADGALAWLQAWAAFSVLSRVSPLAYGVASAAKRAAVVAASLLVLRHRATPLNLCGMALAAAGVLAYNRAKAHDRARADSRTLLPV